MAIGNAESRLKEYVLQQMMYYRHRVLAVAKKEAECTYTLPRIVQDLQTKYTRIFAATAKSLVTGRTHTFAKILAID